MGWLYIPKNRDQLIAHIKERAFWTPNIPIVHRVVGNKIWTLYETDGTKAICLTMIAVSQGDSGYKTIDETAGPYEYDCPMSLVRKASPTTNSYALEWREKVAEFHRRRASAPKPETGMRVTYDGEEYRLHSPAGPKMGWSVVRCKDGVLLRMKATQLARALANKVTT